MKKKDHLTQHNQTSLSQIRAPTLIIVRKPLWISRMQTRMQTLAKILKINRIKTWIKLRVTKFPKISQMQIKIKQKVTNLFQAKH